MLNKLDQGDYAAGVFVDLKKAFDTAGHNTLLENFEHYDIRCVTKNGLVLICTNKKKFVSIDNFFSTTKSVGTGVPQGCVLGPLPFLICRNDFHS